MKKPVKPLGLYIHIPFCKSKCIYCDFYSLPRAEDRMDRYVSALCRQLAEIAQRTTAHTVDSVYLGGGTPSYLGDTVYFGGGTPSWYGAERLCAALQALRESFALQPGAEITLEANPDSAGDWRALRSLRRAGMNRLSLGVQSADDGLLRTLGRPHTFAQTEKAVQAARSARIKNLNLDLIYGLPGQTEESWKKSVEAALALSPEHLSCYGLTVEEGTPLGQRVARGERLPDDDEQAVRYLWTVARLAEAGYEQYEVSNFSKTGRQSRHNLKYWMGRPYIGIGAAAHSDFGGCRYSFVRDLEQYIRGVQGEEQILDEMSEIPQRERGSEYLMLRLRTTRGVEEWEYRREYFMNFDSIEQKLEEYERQGWAERHDRRWNLTPKGFLVSNQLICDLLGLQEEDCLQKPPPRLKQGREDGAE